MLVFVGDTGPAWNSKAWESASKWSSWESRVKITEGFILLLSKPSFYFKCAHLNNVHGYINSICINIIRRIIGPSVCNNSGFQLFWLKGLLLCYYNEYIACFQTACFINRSESVNTLN